MKLQGVKDAAGEVDVAGVRTWKSNGACEAPAVRAILLLCCGCPSALLAVCLVCGAELHNSSKKGC
jgi:hypothetical protein